MARGKTKNRVATSRERPAARALLSRRAPLLTAGLVVVVAAAAAVGYPLRPVARAATVDPLWNVQCALDHFAPDDPIVFPGQPGLSHMHSFYGNTTTNAYSTTASIQAGTSNCINNLNTVDHSAYWIPSLYKGNRDGANMPMSRANQDIMSRANQDIVVYYRRPGGSSGPQIKPFPVGLRMIAGNPAATSPQSTAIVQWDCGDGGPDLPSPPSNCTASQPIHASLFFPNCWDGVHLDTADHRSHMAYADPNTGACPPSHPVSLPELNFEIYYNGFASDPGYYLASGGVYSMHGDFIAAWNNQAQNALVASCLNTPHDCEAIFLAGSTFQAENNTLTFDLKNFSAASPWSGLLSYAPGSASSSTSTQRTKAAMSNPQPQTAVKPADTTSAAQTSAPAAAPTPHLNRLPLLLISSLAALAVIGLTALSYVMRRRRAQG